MPTIVASTVVTLETIDVAVFVTTPWTPPMSLEMRDCTSPVRVRVKNASDSRCRCRKTAARRSCITRWPTWFDRSVCQTPSTPLTIAIAIIPAANTEISLEFWSPIACRRSRSRNAGTTPSAAETRISASTTASRRRYGRKSRAIRFRFARRTAGSAGRSGGLLIAAVPASEHDPTVENAATLAPCSGSACSVARRAGGCPRMPMPPVAFGAAAAARGTGIVYGGGRVG